MPFPMHDKVAIVTGASSGIGLSVARRFAGAGARVVLVARTRGALEEAARSLGGDDRALPFAADVTDFPRLAALPSEVLSRFGRIDYLVNNAGLNHRGPILAHSAEALAQVISVNLTAPIYLTRLCADHIRPGGAIVNVASLAGMIPVPDEAAYSASKAGLRAFSRALAEEMRGREVHVASVCPGPVDTSFFGDVQQVPDLVFSQPMSSAEQVAEVVMQAIERRKVELALPALSGTLATLGYLFPDLARRLRPLLELRGKQNKARYLAAKGTP